MFTCGSGMVNNSSVCFRITYENDIALLRLETPFAFNEFVGQLNLPQMFQNFTGGNKCFIMFVFLYIQYIVNVKA